MPDQRPEASLASYVGNPSGEADHAAHGARSESESHAIERRKTFRGSLCFSHTKGHAAALYGLVQAVLPTSTEHVQTGIGILQELERSCLFLSEIPDGEPDYQLQALAAHSSAGERT